MTALVVEADDPLDNRIMVGKHTRGLVRILIDSESSPIYVARSFKLDRDHWPVGGMELPVTIDPADPEQFDVNWDEIPSMEERAAANDPSLADPIGTRRKAMERLIASGAAGPGTVTQGASGPATSGVTPEVRKVVVAAQAAAVKTDTGLPDHFEESMDKAAQEPAPAGKTRAVVLIAASEATLRTEGADDHVTGYYKDRHGKHATVLAVNVPGSAPYAVFKPKFKHVRGKGSALGAGLPALVSQSDPTDVEVLWDELPSVKEQARATAAEAMQATQDRMAEATKMMSQGFQQAGPSPPPPPAAPEPGAATAPQMPANTPPIPANMQEMMAKNAKTALSFTKDPAMRKMLIAQYRAAGIEIGEDEEEG